MFHTTITSPADRAPRIPIRSLPFDLYRDVHKAIRVNLFEVVSAAGRTDGADRSARVELAGRVRDLVDFLVFHAAHEDRELNDAIAAVLPDRAAQIAADHVALEADMERLVGLASSVFDCDATEADGRGATHELYLELAAFTSDYLAHQDVEERIVGPAIFDHLGLEECLTIHHRILSAISPDEMGWSLAKMVPSINVDDRTEMFVGMRADAPAEAFQGMLALACDVLPGLDFQALVDRLDAIAASEVAS